MAYTVLARKYRSQTFDDVIGQEPIARTLKNAIKMGRVAHAYLFTGTRGVGKTTMARVLAKALNCLSFDAPTVEPCCKCESCVAINAGEDVDVIEIDGASNNGVDEVRKLRENAIYRPARARFKIYIIDEVHMLSTGAFNALLKILEEPPSHVKFIFATTESNKVIPTIQSRCQRFDFVNISPAKIDEQLKNILKQENIKYEDDLILAIAKMANGSMRDGLSLLDRLISTGVEPLSANLLEEYLGCPNSEKIHKLVSEIGGGNAAGAIEAIEDLINGGLSEVQIVDALIDYMRDLMVVKSAGAETKLVMLTAQQRKQAAELVEKFDIAGLIYNITALEKLRWTIRNSDTARALLEASVLRFAMSEQFLNVDQLLLQLKSGSAETIKKKQISYHSKPSSKPDQAVEADLPQLNDIEAIKGRWQNILEAISDKLGSGTRALLVSAQPVRLEDGVLTITLGAGGETKKRMCESNGKKEQLESIIGNCCGISVKLKFDAATNEQVKAEPVAEKSKTSGARKNELINDPAVKTVLMELDATITKIDETINDEL
jgi:DNA polymerase-3 subunit gamma/tau